MNSQNDERLVSASEFQARLASRAYYFALRKQGRLPPPIRLGRRVFYAASEVQSFFERLKSEAVNHHNGVTA